MVSETDPVNPILLPRPRRIEPLGGVHVAPAATAQLFEGAAPGAGFARLLEQAGSPASDGPGIRLDDSSDAEASGYRLILRGNDADPVELVASDAQGRRNGIATLAQLLTQYGRKIPAMVIEDGPAFANRGVMLDISRCRVPTMDSLEALVDLLASVKINHLQLYTEHTFAYRGHEEVWDGCSPMTGEQVRQLDERCKSVGITLAANQNCLGHMHCWLALPRYAPLAEVTGEWDFLGMRREGGFSLCPSDPGSIELVENLLGQLLPCFSSRIVNIGCDEAVDIGQGRSKLDVARRGWRVYADFVSKVASLALDQGFSPMFWADIALEKPESLSALPDEMLALAWGYEPDSPFERWGRALRDANREFWVCPGTSAWRSITGRTTERRGNIATAVRSGLEHEATGLLVTDWGDVGHRQQWPISLRGIADAAEAAWSGDLSDDANASLHAFGDATGQTCAWLDELGDSDLALREVCGQWSAGAETARLNNSTALFADMDREWESEPAPGRINAWESVRERLDDLARRVPDGAGELVRDEMAHATDVALIAADRAIARRSAHSWASTDLASRVHGAIAEHRRLWLARSRPGGLDESCGHYQRLIAEFEEPDESSMPTATP